MEKAGNKLSINLSAIVYRDGDTWIAHCLELDIVAEGAGPDDALRALVSLCDWQIQEALAEGDLPAIFRPAPPQVWQMFWTGHAKKMAKDPTHGRSSCFEAPVDRFEARELAFA